MKSHIQITLGLMSYFCLVSNVNIAQYYRYPVDTNLNNIANQFYVDFDEAMDTLEGGTIHKFLKWEQFWGPRLAPSGSFQVAQDHIRNFVNNYNTATRESELVAANWTEIGPKSNGLTGIGMVNDIAFHPYSEDTLLCGSSDGGVWRSTDKGQHWYNLNTDFQLARLGVSTIAIDPINPNYIYIGTGDVDYEFSYSDGVYRTINGGQTWESINDGFLSSFDGLFLISKILVDPTNQAVMYVAGTFGIYKCENRMESNPSWSKVYPADEFTNQNVRNIFFKPTNYQTIYGVGIDVIRSTESGNWGSWHSIANQETGFDLTNTPEPNVFEGTDFPYLEIMNMAVGSHNKYLYINCITRPNSPPYNWNDGYEGHIYRFDVSSEHWDEVDAGDYRMIVPGKHELEVSPISDDIVYGAGIFSYRSIDAGLNWPLLSLAGHMDYHEIKFSPYNSDEIYSCTDGGIWKKNINNITPIELNDGLGVGTIYYFGTSEIDPDQMLSGLQDIGIDYYKGLWSHINACDIADGFECLLDYNDINLMYATTNNPNGLLYKGRNANNPYFAIVHNPPEPSYFGAPLVMSSQTSNTIYQGYRNLWINDHINNNYPSSYWYVNSDLAPFIQNELDDPSWFQIIRSIEICETNVNKIYLSIYNANHTGTQNQLSDCIILKSETGGGLNDEDWTIITPPGERYFVRDLAVSSHDPNKIWLTYSSYEAPVKVVKSIDGGLSWTNYGDGLPDLPVNCIVYEFGSNDALYVGTDVGVYYRDNSLNQWEPFMNGLPNVVVNCLEINYTANKLRAGTFGRGLWESDLNCASDTHNIVINYNQTWKRNYKLSGTLTVQNGAILTIEKDLNCTENSTIIVERGGELIIDGGKITNNCGQMWQGIQVWGTATASQSTPGAQGKLTIINGGTIENAIAAVRLARSDGERIAPGYEGGIIQTDDAHFINNRTGVRFYPYRYQVSGVEVDNLSFFYNTEFLTDAELADQSLPEKFIHFDNIKGINVKGCSFINSRPEEETEMNERGVGIYSEDANFTVTDYCLDTPGCEDLIPSVFQLLNYGIEAYKEETTKSFKVNNTNFYNNLTGIYIKGVDNPEIIFNDFELKSVSLFYQLGDIFGGLYLDYSPRFTVEENYFYNEDPYDPHDEISSIGITVNNSGNLANIIYRNTFDRLHVAILAQNGNRGTSYTTGLKLHCNVCTNNMNDFAVTGNGSALYQGISEHQGAYGGLTAPAGNLFSHEFSTDPYRDFNNTLSGSRITYYQHNGSPGDPWELTYYQNITKNEYGTYPGHEEACPAHFHNGGGHAKSSTIVLEEDELKDLLIQREYQRDSLINILNLWVDAGDTPQLDYTVECSTPDEALEVYDELISDSPYLSDTVLSTSIEKEDVLVNAMVRDIMVANPHGAKKEALVESLEQRVPPLPDYMMAEIMNGLDTLSLKELKEGEISWYEYERNSAFAALLNLYLSQTTESGSDSLISLISSHGYLNDHYFLASKYLENGDITNSLSLLNDLPNKFPMTTEELSEYQDYLTLYSILADLKQSGQPLDSMNASSRQTLYQIAEDNFTPGMLAQNILQRIDSLNYNEIYILPSSESAEKNYYGENLDYNPNFENEVFRVYPNPCLDYFIIEYFFKYNPQNVTYSIIDPSGRTIEEKKLEGQQNQIIRRVANLAPGLYTIKLVMNEKVVKIAKLTIVK